MSQNSDAKEIALKYIKKNIINCFFSPGSAIQADEIAARLGISKTPVREALLELQYDGYVSVIPRKNTIVSRISLQDLKDVYDARAIVEPHIISSIEVSSNLDIIKILREEWVNMHFDSRSREDYLEFLHADMHFHLTLIQLYPNPHLVKFCQELIFKSQRFWYIALFNNDPEAVREEHLHVLDILLTGDTAGAAAICRKHISVSKALSILSD